MSGHSLLRRLVFLVCATASGAPAQSWSSGFELAADEIALNFAAGPRSKQIYKDVLDVEESDARVTLGALLDAGRYGAVIEGRREGGVARVRLERRLGDEFQ